MKRRVKLITTLATMSLAIALMVTGVFAVWGTTGSFNIGTPSSDTTPIKIEGMINYTKDSTAYYVYEKADGTLVQYLTTATIDATQVGDTLNFYVGYTVTNNDATNPISIVAYNTPEKVAGTTASSSNVYLFDDSSIDNLDDLGDVEEMVQVKVADDPMIPGGSTVFIWAQFPVTNASESMDDPAYFFLDFTSLPSAFVFLQAVVPQA
ncbi:MAG: hypothetical protein LBH24_07165 [Clostridiales bacterium]|jgi:hypothetical protein|nr:hypothetical protein [Clostridiales bacterium]